MSITKWTTPTINSCPLPSPTNLINHFPIKLSVISYTPMNKTIEMKVLAQITCISVNSVNCYCLIPTSVLPNCEMSPCISFHLFYQKSTMILNVTIYLIFTVLIYLPVVNSNLDKGNTFILP